MFKNMGMWEWDMWALLDEKNMLNTPHVYPLNKYSTKKQTKKIHLSLQ